MSSEPGAWPLLESRLHEIVREIAVNYGANHVHRVLIPDSMRTLGVHEASSMGEALHDPYRSLKIFLARYAFVRRGRDADLIGRLATEALAAVVGAEGFSERLRSCSVNEIGLAATEKAASSSSAHTETLRTILGDAWGLCQFLDHEFGIPSITAMAEREIATEGGLENSFHALCSMRGVGPKAASTFLRDVVLLLKLEDKLAPDQRLYCQPVDRWLRAFVTASFPDLQGKPTADWVVAGKSCKLARLAGVSAILFNIGVTSYGRARVQNVDRLPDDLLRLACTLKEQPQAV